LKDKVPISSLAEELAIQPTQIYQWVSLVLEHAEQAFEKTSKSNAPSRRAAQQLADLKDRKIKHLEAKLVDKNEVIAELMEENVKSKKANGGL